MAAKIQLRRDTASVWASVNPTLALGEPGVETDTYKVKVGDGTSDWNTLPYSITTQFADLNGKPTTIAGYAINDAYTKAEVDAIIESPSGNLTGSVFADDSSIMIDGVAGKIVGQLEVSDPFINGTIDTTDSSPITITPDVLMNAGLTVGNHIIPSSNENIDLGSASARFRDLYLSGNSAVIGDLALKRHTSGGLIVSDHSTGNPTNVTTHNITANDITAAGDVDVTGNLTMTGYIAGPATMTIDPAAVGDNTGTLVVAGNLQVDGTTTTINSTTLEVEDKNVVLGPNAANDAANNGAGITVTQPDTTDATLIYDTTSTQWELNKDLDVTGDITVSGTVDGRDLAADGTVIDGLGTASTSAATDFVAVTGDDMTGALSINSGTANTALSLESTDSAVWLTMTDPTASLFFGNTGGEFALWTGGTESFRVDDNGNVGIGYNNPSNNIHILGSDASPNVGITLQSDDTANATATLTLMARDASNVNQTVNIQNTLGRLNIDANMDVIGVGTNFKSASYNILNLQTDTDDNGSSDDGIFKITNGSAGTTKAEFRWDESEDLVHVSYGDHGRHISINSSGNVGIGTSSVDPDLKLHVDGTNGYPASSGTTPVGHIAIRAKSNSSSHGAHIGVADASPWGTWIQAQDANNLATSYPLLLNPNGGNVGIGETGPDYQLHVSGAGDIKVEDTGGGSAHIHIASSTSGLRDSEWRLKTSGQNDEFTFDHRYTANDGSNDVVGNGTVLTLKSDANVDVTNDVVANNAKLKAIAKDISDTAVDVFIYDTRKDSDGGAWRGRTQHTSWYNETLNTATRGSRKEFPAVAVIVAEVDTVTIYDGDDPALPMWMVWEQAGVLSWASGTTTTSISITALNGKFVWGTDERGSGIADFIKDDIEIFHGPTEYVLTDRKISSRSTSSFITDEGYSIIHPDVIDVAMTVLPNAPVDRATGLPIPTIAVATESGVSIIKDDGTVVDITESSNSTNITANVEFLDNGRLVFRADGNTDFKWIGRIDIPTSNTTYTYVDESQMPYVMYSGAAGTARLMLTPPYAADSSTATTAFTSYKDNVIAGTIKGFGQGTTDPTVDNTYNGNLVNYTSSSYNTGWMNGDIKLATLSDTDTTNINGANLCAADDFSSGWTVTSGSNMSISSNQLSVTDTSNVGSTFCDQNISTTVGKEYVIDVTATGTSGTGIGLYVTGYGGPVLGYQWEPTYSFTATATTTTVRLYRFEGHTGSGTITQVIIKEAAADRSVNSFGVSAFGTVTKTAVATGAELVSYSNFSASNYLQQTLDWTIGTDDFTFVFWVNPPSSPSSYFHAISIGTESTSGQASGSGIVLKLNAQPGNSPYFYTGAGGASQSTYDVNNKLRQNEWNQIVAGRKNGDFYIYINGKLAITGSNNAFNISDTVLMIGRGAGLNEFVPETEIALVRISKTSPSPDQIKKMYEDEKFLFQENAKATLYGTSDAITALAYDDDTELLHVGTSAGRSVFQGLTRIDNTTDAVGVAISASNGLIAEE